MSKYSLDFMGVNREYEDVDFEKRVLKPEHILSWLVDFGTEWHDIESMTTDENGERVWVDAFYWHYNARLGLLELRRERNDKGFLTEIFIDDPDFWKSDDVNIYTTHVRLSPSAMKRYVYKGEDE